MKKVFFASVIAALSFSVNAEVVQKDWLSAGDGKSILDTTTGYEWLKLTETTGLSALDIINDERFDGWQFASTQQVVNFFDSASLGLEDVYQESESSAEWWFDYYGSNQQIVEPFVQMIGQTSYREKYDGYFKKYQSSGYIRNKGSAWVKFEDNYYNNGSIYKPEARMYVNLESNTYDTSSFSNSGWFLYNTGGVTVSSINDPSINIGTRDVPVMLWGLPFALLFAFKRVNSSARHRLRKRI